MPVPSGRDILEAEARRYVLGISAPDDLKRSAGLALEKGLDSEALRQLAGLDGHDFSEERSMFLKALAESGLALPTIQAALPLVAREIAQRIVAQECAPYEGARRIWDLTRLLAAHPAREYHGFIYAASEWEDRPDDRPFFEEGIMREARAFLTHGVSESG